MQDKIYALEEMRKLHICTSEYKFNITEEGDFNGTLDLKAQSRNTDIRCFFTIEDGRKFIATTCWFQSYLGVKDIPTGAKVKLTYTKNTKGGIYLTELQVLDDIEVKETVMD